MSNSVDTSRLDALIRQLSPRQLASLQRRGMLRAANDIKKRAVQILFRHLRHVRSRKDMRKSIWTYAYRGVPGFRVTVAGNRHLYPSRMRSGGGVRELPLGRWLETGTYKKDPRKTRKGYTRGTLPAIEYLAQAEQELEPTTIARIEQYTVAQLERIAKKYE